MDNTATSNYYPRTTSTQYISTDNYDSNTDSYDNNTSAECIIEARYRTTVTRGTSEDFKELKEVIMWMHIHEMRENLRRMWFFALYNKMILKSVNNNYMDSNKKNYRILRCNRRGIGLRLKKDR